MNMPERWYRDKLYPLQDAVLSALNGLSNSMYLTGGTALSREYLHHRYSDDLDFFWNDEAMFAQEAERVVRTLRQQPYDGIDVGITTATFVRIAASRGGVDLKIDLVNDVPARVGAVTKRNLFDRVDNLMNILSNKLTALPRQEARDVVDIIHIARNCSFNWMQIVAEARRKDMWVDELDISRILANFDTRDFAKINWIAQPDYVVLQKDLETVAKDLALGIDNSLCRV